MTTTVTRDPQPLVEVFEQSPYHLRPYDFNAGDQRAFTQDEAVERAQHRATARGCRQQVRRVRLEPGDRLTPAWLIQDI